MNNAWRHGDIISFPRLNFKNTRLEYFSPLEALEWLTKNNLDQDEISNLVHQARALPLYHSKTKKKRYFFCSDDLEGIFAHAIAICELRVRIIKPLSMSLIDLDNRKQTLKSAQEKYFFEGFNNEFSFKSKQMNRTLISLIYSIIKKNTNRNPLEITKYIRSHSDVETTNIYIDIPQEHMNFISKQLFDLGPFGYAYETLYQLIAGDLPIDRVERTVVSRHIKEIFGDFYHIENLARYINRLSKEKTILKTTLMKMSDLERKKLMTCLKFGQQPAKYEGFQCVYQRCPYPERECNKCPFAVYHFYSLSELSDNITLFIKEYKEKFSTCSKQGEKVHLANVLYSYLSIVQQAITVFGKEKVAMFFENGLDGLKKELENIDSSKYLITIGEGVTNEKRF